MYVAVTKGEAQRRIWTFYDVVNLLQEGYVNAAACGKAANLILYLPPPAIFAQESRRGTMRFSTGLSARESLMSTQK